MKNKKGLLLTEETVKLLVAALVSLILISVIIALANFLIPKNLAEDAHQELNSLKTELESLSPAMPGPIEYISLKTPEWYLFTWEFGNACNGNFCICICEKINCRQEQGEELQRACTATQYPVLIREKYQTLDSPLWRSINLEKPPQKFFLSYIEGEIYPFVPETAFEGEFEQSQVPSIYFKFDNKWLWTKDPTKPNGWRNLSESTPENMGEAKSSFILDAFLPFIEKTQDPEKEGEAYLSKFNVKKAPGVYLVEKETNT